VLLGPEPIDALLGASFLGTRCVDCGCKGEDWMHGISSRRDLCLGVPKGLIRCPLDLLRSEIRVDAGSATRCCPWLFCSSVSDMMAELNCSYRI
jgi:hypothetical protein